jgi:hypothetical protein
MAKAPTSYFIKAREEDAMIERSTVVGVFDHRDDAERAIAELRRLGFRDDEIGFVWRGGESDLRASEQRADPAANSAGGAIGGALAGAGIGGLVAAAAALLVPGFGPVIAGGVLATVLGGAAVGAAAGGILGALTGMGIPEEEARYYETAFNEGRILVTVKADGRYEEARETLYSQGASDVEHRRGGVTPGVPQTTGAQYAETIEEHADRPGDRGGTIWVPPVHHWEEQGPAWHRRWEARYGSSGGRWEDFEPGYRFGSEMATDPRYRDRDFDEADADLRRDWVTWTQRYGYTHNEGDWDRIRVHAREAWDEARAHRQAA